MLRVWLYIILAIAYTTSTAQAGTCVCTLTAHKHIPLGTDYSPFFIRQSEKLNNQVSLWAVTEHTCTRLCQTTAQLYTHVWGTTPLKCTTEYTAIAS